MRKFYIFTLMLLFGTITANSQSNNMTKPKMISINQPYPIEITKSNSKTVNCTDTIKYPQSKLTGFVETDTMDIATYIGAVSQAYHYSGIGTISGISAYVLLDVDGIPFNSPPISMIIKVYNINSNNYPTTMIDSAVVQVMDVGFQEQALMFSSPIAVADSFAVAIEINPSSPSNPYYVTNTSVNNDGNGEQLSCVTYLGVWYNALLDFGGWDMDLMLAPIFSESFTATFTVDTNSVCLSNSVLFTNTTVPHNNSMFHPLANSYSLDIDGGTTIISPFDTNYTHYYTEGGTYNSQLTATEYGYSTNCLDISNQTVTVLDTAISNYGFVDMGGGVFQFSDSSTSAVGISSWLWDFGDASVTSSLQNPSHTYAFPGNYMVCLTVSDTNGCNLNTICDSVSFTVDIDDFFAADFVKVYPIPAKKYFNVTVPTNYFGGEVIITDVVGQQLKSVAIENQEKVRVSTESIASGIYFVSVDYNGERVFTKRIVIDK